MSFRFLSKTEHMSNEIIILWERSKQASKCLSTDNQEVEIVNKFIIMYLDTLLHQIFTLCERVDYMSTNAPRHLSLQKVKMLCFQ